MSTILKAFSCHFEESFEKNVRLIPVYFTVMSHGIIKLLIFLKIYLIRFKTCFGSDTDHITSSYGSGSCDKFQILADRVGRKTLFLPFAKMKIFMKGVTVFAKFHQFFAKVFRENVLQKVFAKALI
jgi:hypothetical protein